MSSELTSAFIRALALHQAGRLADAEEMYRQIALAQPDHFDSLHLLGVICHQRGDYAAAVRHMDAALALNPDFVSAHNNRGIALSALKRFDEALASYDRAIALKGDDAELFYNRGNALKDLLRFEEAVASYDRAIALKADYAVAFYNRGNALLASERCGEAAASYDQAIALRRDHVHAHINRGIALSKMQRFDAALGSFAQAAALDPGNRAAWINHGIALEKLERPAEALASFDRAIACDPGSAAAFDHRGNALSALGRFEAAVASFDRAIALDSNGADTFSNRGNALRELGRFDEALLSCEQAIALEPGHFGAWINRGNALSALKEFDEALASYDRAMALDPHDARAFYNRANARKELRQLGAALTDYDQAISLKGDHADAFANRGSALAELGRYNEALADFDKAIALKGDDADALDNRGAALAELGRTDEALASYHRAIALAADHKFAFGHAADCMLKACDWSRWDELSAELRRHVTARKSRISPFLLLGTSDDPALQLACAQHYVRDRFGTGQKRVASGAIWRNDRIRVAYLSSDFRRHATAFLAAELFERHDRSRFEVIGVSFGVDDGSDMRARLTSAFDRFIDVRTQGDKEVARLIDDLRIDIAVDLNGHTLDGRPQIMSFRPAPIQASYLGFPGTMGADFIDYIIADAIVLPFDQQPHFSERIVHLPDCYQVNDRKRGAVPNAPTRKELALPAEDVVFCCFNGAWKITPPVFDVWMRLLRAVDGSVLWLFRSNLHAEANLRDAASARGIDPRRLVFADLLPYADHLARHRLADLFLDTLPCNAHTTASDALWSGLPLLTCRGQTFAGRVASSLLNAVGLPELVTDSLHDYEALALRLATDRSLLSGFRERLEKNRLEFPLFNTERFCRHIEAAYATMWELWQRGERPQSFAVEPHGHARFI
jgi:predicted O-linked N-acetylglucosamine transferase (SPINDLY family)